MDSGLALQSEQEQLKCQLLSFCLRSGYVRPMSVSGTVTFLLVDVFFL